MRKLSDKVIEQYEDLSRALPFKHRLRTIARDASVLFLSAFSNGGSLKEWVRFPYYHHVFDDEREGFARHLRFMSNRGDFISIDDAVDIFERKTRIGGKYFCITFDDGFKNVKVNALPILIENKCPAVFFISTNYIGCDIKKDTEIAQKFFEASKDAYPFPVEFLSWDDCRKLIEAGMTIGSHTCSHVPLKELDELMIRSELVCSKQKIERELKTKCEHFCCPWGNPGIHFKSNRDPLMAKEVGYRSFSTNVRGPNLHYADQFMIKRDHLLAGWGNYQLQYFLSKQ